MASMIDQIRASKLPSNMMQFAARGALSVTPEENLEILVYLARHNSAFGGSAKMTLAGWDEKSSLAAAANASTAPEVLAYFVEPENLRPKLLPALLENPTVRESDLVRLAQSASPDGIAKFLQSARVRGARAVVQSLRSNPYLKANEAATVDGWLRPEPDPAAIGSAVGTGVETTATTSTPATTAPVTAPAAMPEETVAEEAVSAYFAEHAAEISAEEGKPFQPIGGIVDLLGEDYFPVSVMQNIAIDPPASGVSAAAQPALAKPAPPVRENTVQKINRLDVKGRIQLALKGTKEERAILIRDGTKVVSFAVLDAPKLSDGEVEKFALQKNVLEAVLRQITLKRRFMKNYVVVRNLVSNPRSPLDLSLGLMKHLLIADLKNISGNKEVSETVRSLAGKMVQQKSAAANKK
jgi:hypothetical protein